MTQRLRIRSQEGTWLPRGNWSGLVPDAPPPPPPPTSAGMPTKVIAAYHMGFNANEGASTPALTSLHSNYNVVLLSFALASSNGSITWNPQQDHATMKAQMAQMVQQRGTKFWLSVGGGSINSAGGTVFTNSTHAAQFRTAFASIKSAWPNIVGIDWDLENDQATWNIATVRQMSVELKQDYGSGFVVACAAQPAVVSWKQWAQQASVAGAMDFFGMQFYDYDATNADRISGIKSRINQMIGTYGLAPAQLGIGCKTVSTGVSGPAKVSSASVFAQAFNELEATHPSLRGAYVWNSGLDASVGYSFATTVGSAVFNT